MLVTAFLFLSYGASPFQAYFALFHEPFATLRGFGYSLVRASPLALIALGTIVSWRSGFSYLGFEGCFVIGAAATGWLALADGAGRAHRPASVFSFFCRSQSYSAFVAGGAWAGLVGVVRARLGGNEVLISLMSNYVAIFFLQYLVSGPMRAPGSLPETPLLPRATWLPFILPGTRAHAGILIAIAAAALVWMLLQKMPLGYELIVTGFNPFGRALRRHRRGTADRAGRIFCRRTRRACGNGGSARLAAPADGRNQRRRGFRRNHRGAARAAQSARGDSHRAAVRRHVGRRGRDAAPRQHSFLDHVHPAKPRGAFCAGIRCAALLQNQFFRFLARRTPHAASPRRRPNDRRAVHGSRLLWSRGSRPVCGSRAPCCSRLWAKRSPSKAAC